MAGEVSSTEISLRNFQTKIEQKYDVKFGDYSEFHRWTVENSSTTWTESWDYFGIISSVPYSKVVEHDENNIVPIWFPDARLNYAENLLRDTGNKTALIIAGEEKNVPEIVTSCGLREEVSTLASAMRKVGIKSGDIVACLVSNRKEAIIAMFAAASIGAIFSASNAMMGAKTVTSRFQQIQPKMLFTIDRHVFNREEYNILDILPTIVNDLPSIEHVVIVPSNERSLERNISHIKNSIFYPEFFNTGLNSDGTIPEPRYEQLPFNHPFLICFTSGTTGPPKGIVHSLGAALLAPLQNINFVIDVRKSDVIWATVSPGWIAYHMLTASLGVGATMVLYEGMPFFQKNPTIWDMIDEFKVVVLFLPTPAIEGMQKQRMVPAPHNTLKTLRSISAGSSTVKAHLSEYIHNNVKKDVAFGIVYGSTETFLVGGFNLDLSLPINDEEIQIAALAVDFCCYSAEGERIYDEIGELVIANSFPSMPLYMTDDPDNEQYMSIFKKFPGIWCCSDACKISSKTRGIIVIGRSDETLKQRGFRFGSSEIYGIVNVIEEVDDSICVSRVLPEGDSIAVLFVKLKVGLNFTAELETLIRTEIKKELSFLFVPEIILPVKDIPYNMNKKKMEGLVKNIIAGLKNIASGTVSNPECLEEYFTISKNLGL